MSVAEVSERRRARVPADLDSVTGRYGFKPAVIELIRAHGLRRVCDVGGGRRPLLRPEEVAALGIEYTVLDLSPDELARAPRGYRTVVGDVCRVGPEAVGPPLDLLVSMYLAEHVGDGAAMHRNIRRLLRPGGIAVHFFPTLWTPVFLLNRLVPEALAERLLAAVIPGRRGHKFPAHYSWCFGPTRRMHERFTRMGYEVLEYRPFYGTHYLERIPVLGALDARLTEWAARRRSPHLTAYAQVVLRRTGDRPH